MNPNIEPWFAKLAQETSDRSIYGNTEKDILKRIMDMLLEKVLIVDPNARSHTKVDFIAEELGRAANAYNALANMKIDMATSGQPTNGLSSRRSNSDMIDSWHVANRNELEQCCVSPDGRSVLFRDADYIKIYSLASLCEPSIPDNFPMLGCKAVKELPRPVEDLAFSNTHVAVLIEQSTSQVGRERSSTSDAYKLTLLQLYIYSYLNSEVSAGFEPKACVGIPGHRVHQMALSPDGCYIACVCTSGDKGSSNSSRSTNGYIYVTKLSELLYEGAELLTEKDSLGKLTTFLRRKRFEC